MFGIFAVLLFLGHVSNKLFFIGAVLVATILPDLDSGFSSWGRHLVFRPLQFFTKHRGIIHSFTTAAVLSIIIAIWWPVVSFGFFLGYCVHLLVDSFTFEGVQPFWPFEWKSKGFIHSGGRIEETIFLTMIFVNVLLFFAVVVVM